MKTVQLEIPAEIVHSMKLPEKQIESRLIEELALHLYQEGMLSFGKSRALAKVSKWQFAERLGQQQIVRHFSEEDLDEDIQFAHET